MTVVGVLTVLLASTGLWPQSVQIPDDDPLLAVYGTCHSAADSLSVLKLASGLEIFDPGFFHVLRKCRDREEFEAQIDRYRRKDAERWDRFLTNFGYCQYLCQTPVWWPAGKRDIRWEYMLVNGPPAVEWNVVSEPRNGVFKSTPTTVYLYTWPGRKTAALAADTVGGYPVCCLENLAVAESWRPIYPYVEATIFPRRDADASDLGISIWIPGDQFNRETVERGFVSVGVYVSRDGHLAAQDSVEARLDLVSAGLGVFVDPATLGATVYFGFDSLTAGAYQLEVKVTGGRSNSGKSVTDLVLPSLRANSRTSDVLFLVNNPPHGDVLPGIRRGDRALYGRAMTIFSRGDTVRPYVEFLSESPEPCSVIVSLVRMPIGGRSARTTVTVGPITSMSEDETGRPWGVQFWKAPPPERPLRRGSDELVVFSGTYPASGPTLIFDERIGLGDAEPGEYWFIVRAWQQRSFKPVLTWTAIDIR